MNRSLTGSNYAIFILLLCAITGIVVVLLPGMIVAPITIGVITALLVSPLFFYKPEWLFYIYMLTYVFGVMGFQISDSLPKISFSNLLFIYAPILLVVRSILLKENLGELLFGDRRKKLVISLSFLLVLQIIISGVINLSVRFLITQVGYFLVIVVVFLTVRDLKILRKSLLFGIVSIGILSTLTILTSLGVLSFGFRVGWNSGTAPWEAYLPRAIGLPQMDGGYHGVFILSSLSLAVVLAIWEKKIGFLSRTWLLGVAIVGVMAIAIAIFRSAWLGLAMSFVTIFIITFRSFIKNKTKAILVLIIPVISIFLAYYIMGNFGTINNELNHFFFRVRQKGVETRIAQYQFALERLFQSPEKFIFGFGEGAFSEDFYLSPSGELLLYDVGQGIGLHNHFLGFFYADGFPYLLVYVIIILFTLTWLFKDASSRDSQTRLLSLGLLAGLVGDIVVLNFTAVLAGYKIIWVIVSIAAILPSKRNSNISSVRVTNH